MAGPEYQREGWMGWRTDSGGDEALRLLAAGAAIPIRLRPARTAGRSHHRVSAPFAGCQADGEGTLKMIMASHAVSGQC